MLLRRLARLAALAALLLGAALLRPPAAGAVAGWEPVAPRPASGWPVHSATRLADGRVLVTSLISSCSTGCGRTDLFDPATGRWTAGAPLPADGGIANPVVLADGRVLFAAGARSAGITPSSYFAYNSAQVYDPATDTWIPVAPLKTGRGGHTTTLLADGTVLVAGGSIGQGEAPTAPTAAVERYDPRVNRWTPAASLPAARAYQGAARLPDGRVLVFGGLTAPPDRPYDTTPVATAVVYDPATDRWAPAASMATPRALGLRAVTLTDGRVLVIGGEAPPRDHPTAELYDPAANRWTAVAPPLAPAALVALADGTVLATGARAALYDPAHDVWAAAEPNADPSAGLATLLADGRVLLVGDRSAELYTPEPPPRACFAATGHCVSGRFLDYWLAHGGLARNGYPLGDARIETLEDGHAYQVQYFERVRMEYHPENAVPYDVLLGQFGRRVFEETTGHAVAPPAAPIAGQTYFQETGHNLGGDFLAYWQANGGLAQFGFPISEVFSQQLEDGKTYQVQYFERARFEAHPENPAPWDIELGQFGRRILAESGH
ncbi:MAG TPA: kelch repeat-containing protein [Thermomicrobiales bacterium]|nr:kelch repeat-containing protein [Thermomicrobiales bacterium]